jgi:hypothetical protein
MNWLRGTALFGVPVEQTGKEQRERTQSTYDDRGSRDDLGRRSGPMVGYCSRTVSKYSLTQLRVPSGRAVGCWFPETDAECYDDSQI